MPMFGGHMSIAGGCHHALTAAREHDFDTVQLFTKNNNQWKAKDLTDEQIALFKSTLKQSNLKFPTAHDSYLINLASPDPTLFQLSLDAFVIEVQRAEALGLSYLVMHPGTPTDGDAVAGLTRIASALDTVHARCPDVKVKVLLETTAGQGKSLGHRFEHLASILERVREPRRLGVCLDTCHVFAAGYSLAPRQEYEKTFDEFDRLIGLSKLKVFHMNDSKKPLGCRVDRHEHIGQGHLGREPFRLLVNDVRFAKVPMIMETPKEGPNGEDMDIVNLQALRELVGKKK
ncbi:MAG TPA: deoxyribonuclease IV [Gemmataceae bacterium]|nr:deoxyribonuclease IV [Gemmataceae bacterium]